MTIRAMSAIGLLLGLGVLTWACTNAETRPQAAAPAKSQAQAVDPKDPCAWEQPRFRPEAPPVLPSGQEGPLADALLGAWQHTFTRTAGKDFEPLRDTTDIRFVFPEPERFVYCQHITGPGPVKIGPATRPAPFLLEDTRLVLPGARGYTAFAWSKDVMLWRNNRRPSETYLLQRR